MKKEIMEQFVVNICKLYEITTDQFYTVVKPTPREVLDARYLFYYIAKNRKCRNYYVLKFLAEKGLPINNTALIHGIKVIKRRYQHDKDYDAVIEKLNKQVIF